MAAVAVFSLFLGNLLTRRLNELKVASHEIAAGNLSHQINEQGNDELADTARSFNQMSGKLQLRNQELLAAQHSLSALNATLEQRVDERTAALQEANQRLQAEQERSLQAEKMASLGRMVAGFAHEVNTPVGVAVGAASQSRDLLDQLERMLTQEEVEEDELKQCIGSLDEAADLTLSNLHRAAGLVKSFKRTAVDQASETERAYDLVEIIEDVQKSLAGSFRNTAIDFEVSCPAAIELYGPAGAATQLLTNLVQNSRMHGFADGTLPGHIRLHAGVDGEQVCIDYSDDGAGMSEECLAHAFEPFFTTRRGSGGSGLGLYIAYNLVTRSLGGTIRCSSQPGKGVQFSIHYPVRRSRAQTGSS